MSTGRDIWNYLDEMNRMIPHERSFLFLFTLGFLVRLAVHDFSIARGPGGDLAEYPWREAYFESFPEPSMDRSGG
jgi:hypothetical protein